MLGLKELAYDCVAINLAKSEQYQDHYLTINPQGLVPALKTESGAVLTQSTAIIEWLEATYPSPSLLPGDKLNQARIRAAVNVIACDIHPLNNLRVLNYLTAELGTSKLDKERWYHHWLHEGFKVLQQILPAGNYGFGDTPTLVDVYLVPQIYNALRFDVDLGEYPKLVQAYEHCKPLSAFRQATPENQADAI